MRRVRYEAEIAARADGTLLITVFDGYWGITYSVVLDRNNDYSRHNANVELFDGAAEVLPAEPGWYAVEIDPYPFGKPVCVFPISGRNQR